MLVLVSVRMINWTHLGHLYVFERSQFIISILTATLCLLFDTMTGLVMGSILSLVIYAKKLSTGHSEIQIFSYLASAEMYVNKEFLAEVNVEMLDSFSLG